MSMVRRIAHRWRGLGALACIAAGRALFAPLAAQAPTSGALAGRVVALGDSAAVGRTGGNASGGVPLSRASVTVVAHINSRYITPRTTTDRDGRFLVGDLPAGPVTLRVKASGYQTAERTIVIVPDDTLFVEVRLAVDAPVLQPVFIDAARGDAESFTAKPNVGTIVMPSRAMAGIPSVGEPDVVRVVQLLPGVTARNDFGTGLNVRGGGADQNLVLLDGIPIYNPFHMGGVFSTFADATVGGIALFTAAFPARFDGRLSSVLDVRSATVDEPGIHSTTDVSVLSASQRLAGATHDGRTQWSLSGRRTYADVGAQLFTRDAFPYHFLDGQARVTTELGAGWRAALTAYGGRDILDLDMSSFVGDSTVAAASSGAWQYEWGNRVIGASLAKVFAATPGMAWLLGDSTVLDQRLSSSGFATTLDVGAGARRQRSAIRDARLGGAITAFGERHDRTVGYELTDTRVRYESRAPQTGITDFDILQRPRSAAVYVSDLWRIGARWLVESGLRGEVLGGERDWSAVSPRLAIKYFATPSVALTAAAGRVSQPLHSLAGDGPFRFFDVWLASDRYIPVETAWHYVVGAERRLDASSIKVEGFLKRYDRVLDANWSEDPARRGDEFLAATGLSYGVDAIARWQSARGLGGWLAYSYGLAMHERDGERWAPGSDRRHDLNVVTTYRRGPYRLGIRFGYATGTPYTPITGQIVRRLYDPTQDAWGTSNSPIYVEPLGGARNSARFPANQRLDLSVARDLRVRGADVTPYLSVINAYNAHNVFVYVYDYSSKQPTRRGFTQFPVLPSAGVRVAF